MIRFFRINDPYRLVFVLIALVAIRVTYGLIGLPLSIPELKFLLLGEWLGGGFSMYSETFDYTAPLSAWTYKIIDFLFGRSRTVHWLISGALVFFQAAMFNRTLLRNKVFSESNYVAAFLYIIFSIATFDYFSLSPQLMSLTFVVVSIDHLIRKMDNVAGDELFLFPGFSLGIAGLFYLPSVAFFLVFLVALILIARASIRRLMLFIYGWSSAYLIVIFLLYINGGLEEFASAYFVEIVRDKIFYLSYFELLQWTVIPSFIFVMALFAMLGKREGSLHAKTQQFMMLVFLASIGVLLISGTLSGTELVFFIPVFTFFITTYFLSIKRRFWRWILPHVMIAGSIAAPYMGLKNDSFAKELIVEEVVDLSMKDQRILIIGPLSPLYLNGQMAGPFFDDAIGRQRLEDLDYYLKAPVFLEIFRRAEPNVVIDQWGAMEKIKHRFPEIEEMKMEIRTSNN
ncbi:MAG: hypothetical protein GY816_01490 [Cytophagales bacterium]|nr:hypothetical protein [Cytophagales bacterium]